MIDITTVNANSIPPEIEILQNENTHLLQQNEKLSQYTNIITSTVLTLLIIGGIIAFSLKNKKDIKEKKVS